MGADGAHLHTMHASNLATPVFCVQAVISSTDPGALQWALQIASPGLLVSNQKLTGLQGGKLVLTKSRASPWFLDPAHILSTYVQQILCQNPRLRMIAVTSCRPVFWCPQFFTLWWRCLTTGAHLGKPSDDAVPQCAM